MIDKDIISEIKRLALFYESANFFSDPNTPDIPIDPSWFMHQVDGESNQETTAFLASSLSFGSRKQFLPKIQQLLDIYFSEQLPPDTTDCFYRMFTCRDMRAFLSRYRELINEYGSLKEYVISVCQPDEDSGRRHTADVLRALTSFFATGQHSPIPKDCVSSCKRLCMFLRWMVRDHSPVDLGIWSDIIDKRTLIIPLDTHVMQQANRLTLINSRIASMSTARKLTAKLLTIFPDDPLKGDYALFGYGVAHEK